MNNSQLAAWPLAQHNDISDDELGRILAARLRGREARLADLEDQQRELVERIGKEREHVAHLRSLLHDLGMDVPDSAVSATAARDRIPTDRIRSREFVAGNQKPGMPPRRPEFASVSLAEAASRLLSSGETMHTNDIARAIYVIDTDEQLRSVNASVRSALAVGVNKQQWERGEQPSTFRIRRRSGSESW
jgi:hypothetical protein